MDGATASKRARAAWAYSQLSQEELAHESGITYDYLRAILSSRPPADVKIETLWQIADAANVPRAFMTAGFSTPTGERRLADDVRMLQGQMDTVLRMLSTRRSNAAGSASTRRTRPEDPSNTEDRDRPPQ